jgi:hypothetical protein
MKRLFHLKRAAGQSGFATIAVVSAVSLLVISMLAYTMIGSMRTFDVQARSQVKQDYSQKEDAMLSALIHIVPNKAIGAMQRYSANNPDNYTWDTIFNEALTIANAEESISSTLLNSLNLGGAISANTGDTQFETASQFVNAPISTHAGGSNRVNGGNWWEYQMLGNAAIGPKLPAALQLSYSDYLLDKRYPIVSYNKKYVNLYTKGLGLSAENYPLYNLIQYPDVKLGYKRPGEYFVAKRNWWAFSLTFGSHNQQRTGIPPVKKDYVLSLYEIPSQIPLSAAALMKVGQFEDGSSWENVTLDGGIFAETLQTEGAVALTGGSISARKTVSVSSQTTVEGRSVSDGFDDLGAREARAADTSAGSSGNTSDFYDASVGGNVGKVAFIPINQGTGTLLDTADGAREERISPTGWNDYSRAARKAQMFLDITDVAGSDVQLPTVLRFRYRDNNNSLRTILYTRGSNWPTTLEPGGTSFPFQTDELDNTKNALIIHMNLLPAFINALPESGGMGRNNSLYIYPRTINSRVQIPSIPSLESDMAVTLRGGKDMTAYTSGFSLISRYRVYIADTLNNVPTSVPANSGLPADKLFYPPLSIFAPEKRFGESLTVKNPVELVGQINSLKTSDTDIVNPLELMNGGDERIAAGKINAKLISLQSPAELPPVHMMNWLITIEEVH